MDNIRGIFGREAVSEAVDDSWDVDLRGEPLDLEEIADDEDDGEAGDDEIVRQEPPPEIGQDERRMQVRAYNHWASLLDDRNFPSIEDLEPENLPDFGPFSVLLDFTSGMEDPAVPYLGDKLAVECGTDNDIDQLSEVPTRSLLSRITDHYMQILANQAPIGFEAEFVNQRGATILYRGILLPFSSDDDSIDFIYGVINWKEMADQITTDELMLEIDQALETDTADELAGTPAPRSAAAMADWADGPGSEVSDLPVADNAAAYDVEDTAPADDAFPSPAFGSLSGGMVENTDTPPNTVDDIQSGSLEGAIEIEEVAEFGLYDCLAAARELAQAARSCEDRSRTALYDAVGRAYDVSLAAGEEPEEFEQLIADNGLTVQERAPMTPVVKLVFGADYDKTRLTEYAAVLGHAHRLNIDRGELAQFLRSAEGGLKGVVTVERQLRREESGKPADEVAGPGVRLAKKLRAMEPQSLDNIAVEGAEFGLVMIRRMPDGSIALLGEIQDDVPLVERAGRKLVAGD